MTQVTPMVRYEHHLPMLSSFILMTRTLLLLKIIQLKCLIRMLRIIGLTYSLVNTVQWDF